MGMYPQPNRWQCGPFALKHALIMLGVIADEDSITKITHRRRGYGTDEKDLLRAAREFDCDLPTVRKTDAERARKTLRTYLKRGIPVLVCIDQWAHWVTIVKSQNGRFILLDSEDADLLKIIRWEQLRKRWVFKKRDRRDRDHVHEMYDLHPVVPQFRVRNRPQLSIRRVHYLRRPENREISRLWNKYVEDLLDICRTRTPLSYNVLTVGEFLRRYEGMILDQIVHWHGDVERAGAKRLLKHLRFVADTLGMVIHKQEEKRTIAGFAVLLTLWAESERNGSPLYEAPKLRKRRRKNW